jgi:hypothetical protein
MTFIELRREYEKQRVGETIYGLVLELAGRVSRRYPARVYNGGLAWDEQSIGDLTQEVVLNHLLDEGQLDYIFAEATTLESVRRLLTRQVKRALHKRRPITVIDRLLKRIDALADKGSIERIGGAIPTYRLLGSVAEWSPIGSHHETAAVNAAAGIPVLYSRLDSSRESQVFTTPALETAVKAFFSVCPVLNEKELRRILEKLLTPWAPASLVPIEYSLETMDQPVIDIDISELDTAVSAWVKALTDEECWVYYYRSRDLPDSAAAARIGKSRATVINIKQRVLEKASQLLVDLDPRLHLDAVKLAQEHCALRLGESW